jgi:hypothetical protein
MRLPAVTPIGSTSAMAHPIAMPSLRSRDMIGVLVRFVKFGEEVVERDR